MAVRIGWDEYEVALLIDLKAFLQDSGIAIKNKKQKEPLLTRFGEIITDIGIDSSLAWGLIACNWAYSSQFGWWIKNIDLNTSYSPEAIHAMLDDTISENVRGHIVSALLKSLKGKIDS